MKALKPAFPIRARSFPFFTEAQPSIGTVADRMTGKVIAHLSRYTLVENYPAQD
jgi:hypothetical protein